MMLNFNEFLSDKEGIVEIYLSSSNLEDLVRFKNELNSKGYFVGSKIFIMVETYPEVLALMNNIDFEVKRITIEYQEDAYFIYIDTKISNSMHLVNKVDNIMIGLHIYLMDNNSFNEIMNLIKKYNIDIIEMNTLISKYKEVLKNDWWKFKGNFNRK